ncbi:ATP-dependent Clp protease proteolytic subunit [Couchioplanes azureus]|uniref:ATP-dependent Clp protease proteolytic subunit n=1 Tax=Couchioplanes caeruleus TaxID=56438 RepID=UPI0016714206|nr:ATP-dependent Clp protease proteolytic subunit [Couchioplanes caeruleus]GGQ51339.1 ATP-dependent Clp protease proteolytic subunit 2 [Couchioplanes caeruleus subsp. azureus]
MDLRHDPMRWQPFPPSPESWPPGTPGAGGPTIPGWLEERLFDQRIVMIRGPLTGQAATGIAAALLTLDAAGPEPVHLHMASGGGELNAAHAVVDVIDAMTAPVHAVVTSEAGGAVVAVLAAAQRRSAYRHARFKLAEPRAAGVTGTADEVAAAAGQHLRELEEVILRLVEVTGQTRSRVEDDLSAGRILSAEEAKDYGLIEVVIAGKTR